MHRRDLKVKLWCEFRQKNDKWPDMFDIVVTSGGYTIRLLTAAEFGGKLFLWKKELVGDPNKFMQRVVKADYEKELQIAQLTDEALDVNRVRWWALQFIEAAPRIEQFVADHESSDEELFARMLIGVSNYAKGIDNEPAKFLAAVGFGRSVLILTGKYGTELCVWDDEKFPPEALDPRSVAEPSKQECEVGVGSVDHKREATDDELRAFALLFLKSAFDEVLAKINRDVS